MTRCTVRAFLLLSLAGAASACGSESTAYPDVYTVVVDAGPDAVEPDADPGMPILRLDYLDPDHGPFSGGTLVLMRGRGFLEGMSVSVGGRDVEVLDVTVIDDRRATIRTPPGDPGAADVVITVGGLTAMLDDAFLYEAITVDPPSGSVAGGTYVRITGFGTDFQPGDVVELDGAALAGVQIISNGEIVGYTPPGVAGSADVTVTGPSGTVEAEDAFTYTNSSDPFQGGMGGGPITGAANITVVDAMTQDGIDMAYVTLDGPGGDDFSGYTDMYGQITFSTPTLTGDIIVMAAAAGYETTAFVTFDAQDLTIFLVPVPDPMPGPLPPGRAAGYISGHILFGDATGIGTTGWTMVPEPRTPSEIKRAYVMTTYPNPFSGNPDPGPGSIINYVEGDGATAWDYQITARPAALAVVAVAGLYDPLADPDGPTGPLPPGVFTPFALGVTRGILVGPGELVTDVAVVVNIPLDTAIEVQLVSPPPLYSPGWYGPTEYQTQAFIDLGGEGVVVLPGNRKTLPPGATDGLLPGMAPIIANLSDASYTIFAGAYSYGGSNPFSVRVLRGITDLSAPVIVEDFLGSPRPVDPPYTGLPATWQHVQFAPEAGTTGTSTFNIDLISDFEGIPFWRIFTDGNVFDVPLPDFSGPAGSTPLPVGEFLIWTVYEIGIEGGTFDQFNYGWLNANYWSAYAADAWAVQFPAP